MLRNWRHRNGWTPYTAACWAADAGFQGIPYGALQLIEEGKGGELRQKAFFQLQELNSRLATQNYGSIGSQKILEQVTGARPLGSAAKAVWDATDFWACYVGLLPVPDEYA